MKRSNFVIGLSLSAVVHAVLLFFLLNGSPQSPPAPPNPPPVMPVQIASIDPEQKLPIEQVETEQQPVITTPETSDAPLESPVPAPLPLERVVEPSRAAPQRLASMNDTAAPSAARPSPEPAAVASTPAPPVREAPRPQAAPPPPAAPVEQVAAAQQTPRYEPPTTPAPVVDNARPAGRELEGTGDLTPPLRVHWRDARELVSVARTLGMRLAAVDGSGDIIGEVALTDPPTLKNWSGLPYGYSNRVRMLSPSIFSPHIGDDAGVQVRDIWVFVPSDRDRTMIEAQKEAVRRAGARLEDVRSVDGKFVRAADGSYRLNITNIRWHRGGSDRNG